MIVVEVNIHVARMTDKSWEVVCIVLDVRQLSSEHGVTFVASSLGWRVL